MDTNYTPLNAVSVAFFMTALMCNTPSRQGTIAILMVIGGHVRVTHFMTQSVGIGNINIRVVANRMYSRRFDKLGWSLWQ